MNRFSVYGKLTAIMGHQADPDSIYIFEVWESALDHRQSLEWMFSKNSSTKPDPLLPEWRIIPV